MDTVTTFAGLILWSLLLLASLLIYRSSLVATGKRAANQFNPDGTDVSEFAQRLTRAYGNCMESFPIIGGTLLLAIASGQTAVTDTTAYLVLAARVVQSLVHLSSTSVIAVQLRFMAFVVQLALCAYWLVQLAGWW